MDPDLIVDEKLKARLLSGGMDDLLATHFAHLFIRDPIVVFAEDLKELDLGKTDHFENLQSTNWQHMRFKPPPHNNDTGWRVEFRSMEIQMTDLENAAFSIFIVLITRAILSFDLNFYIPIPLTTANMETAHARDALLHQKFHFRNDPLPPPRPIKHIYTDHSCYSSGAATPITTANHTPYPSRPATPTGPIEKEHSLMTIDEIINGQKQTSLRPSFDHVEAYPNSTNPNNPPLNHPSASPSSPSHPPFPGLIPLVESYLSSVNVSLETRCALARYLDLIRKRASGELYTPARWIRDFVRGHAEYRGDSVVSEGVTYDLVRAAEEIARCEGYKSSEVDGSGDTAGGREEHREPGLGKEMCVPGWEGHVGGR